MTDIKKKAAGVPLIILAGILWGTMGLFVRRLTQYGFSSIQITSMRITVGALVFCIFMLCTDRKGFKLSVKDIPLFLGLGICSVLFFTVCYFTAISMMPLSIAAILLYTSPIWVMLMSALVFRERVTARKLAALALAFAGCVLVSGLNQGGLSVTGLLVGLGAGFGYGLYSILGTIALRKYSSLTVTTYTFIIAAVGSWFIAKPAQMLSLVSASSGYSLLLLIIACALITAVAPYSLYTKGLQSVEASRAAILATVEPMVATIIGIMVFAEPLTLTAAVGIALILAAIVILNTKKEDSDGK